MKNYQNARISNQTGTRRHHKNDLWHEVDTMQILLTSPIILNKDLVILQMSWSIHDAKTTRTLARF